MKVKKSKVKKIEKPVKKGKKVVNKPAAAAEGVKFVAYDDMPEAARELLEEIEEVEAAKERLGDMLLELVDLIGANSFERSDGTAMSVMVRDGGVVFWRVKPTGRPRSK